MSNKVGKGRYLLPENFSKEVCEVLNILLRYKTKPKQNVFVGFPGVQPRTASSPESSNR